MTNYTELLDDDVIKKYTDMGNWPIIFIGSPGVTYPTLTYPTMNTPRDCANLVC